MIKFNDKIHKKDWSRVMKQNNGIAKKIRMYMIQFFNSVKKDIKEIRLQQIILIGIGAAILTFGVTNVHQRTDITEGGVLGIIVLLYHNFGIQAAVSAPILDVICYSLAFRYLGTKFLVMSGISSVFVTVFFSLWEYTGPLLPNLSHTPLIAAAVGAIFIGIGVGFIVTQGGSSGGDDAIVIIITNLTKLKISRAYMITDTIVLFLSLSYISLTKIGFSLLSATLSSIIIGYVQEILLSINKKEKK